MDKNAIKPLFVLVFTALVLYFSGNHLLAIGKIRTFQDGVAVISFFLCFFPFVSMILFFLGRAVKLVTAK